MANVVLVTGVSRYIGSRLAGQLAADPGIARVIGVDTAAPSKADQVRIGRTEFVRADIRNPLIANVLRQAKVDTVVHASVTATPGRVGGRAPMNELNVIGTMQLLAACQKTESVRRFVLKSTTSVYGSSPRDPALFTEDTPAKGLPRSGYAKDSVEVEGYVRGFSRRRSDTTVTVLRFANFIGPTIDTPFTRYLALPVVPTPLGYDPRLQFVHEDDAIEVLRQAATSDRQSGHGVFNVAGDDVLLLSQAVRKAGRVPVPVPGPAVSLVGGLVRRTGLVDFSPEQMQFLDYGRAVDTTRLRELFGYTPRFTTPEAFDAFLVGRPVAPVIPADRLRDAEHLLTAAVSAVSRTVA